MVVSWVAMPLEAWEQAVFGIVVSGRFVSTILLGPVRASGARSCVLFLILILSLPSEIEIAKRILMH